MRLDGIWFGRGASNLGRIRHGEVYPSPPNGGASGRGRLVLACGAVVAMLGGPVSADECSDYRAASVLYHAADKALTDFRDTLTQAVGAVAEPVEGRGAEQSVGEGVAPLGEVEVGGDYGSGAFVALGNEVVEVLVLRRS